MREAPRARLRGLVVAACGVACSFDTSGAATASFGMSLGEVGPDVTGDGSEHASGDPSGVEDGSAGSGGVDGSGTSGAIDCGADSCIAAAPQGWAGPFAISVSDPPDPMHACAPGWTEHVYAWRELHADPATCNCVCQPIGGACTITATYYSDAGCSAATSAGMSSGDCKDMYSQDSHDYVRMTATATGTGCTPAPANVVPPVTWTEGALLCAPPAGSSCDGGSCLPATPDGFDDGRWCINADGQLDCNDPVYSHLLLVHKNVTDTRDCTTCTCGLQGVASCPGNVDEYYQPFCFLDGPGIPVDGSCHASGVGNTNGWSFEYDGAPPSYVCGGNGSAATGDAVAADPMTICCTQ